MSDRFENRSWFRHGTVIDDSVVGPDTFVGFRTHLRHATTGTGCQIASRAVILGNPHEPISMGDGVWIGVGAVISAGVGIGDHAIVGAGAHVHEDVLPYTVCSGRPAARRGTATTRFSDGCGIAHVRERVLARGYRDTSRSPQTTIRDPEGFFDCALECGTDVSIGSGAILIGRPDGPSSAGGIRIGSGTTIGAGIVAEGGGGLIVGAGVSIGRNATITTSTHDFRRPGRPWTAAPVEISPGAFIGDNVLIVGPVHIGAHARVETNSVITRNVAPCATVKGVFG